MEAGASALPGRRLRRRPEHTRRAQADARHLRTAPIARDQTTDAVVIGAGHNGLIAAAYLARAGMRVVVCEARDTVGGATVTSEIAPGFRVSRASYALSLLRPEIPVDLELERHGLVAVPKDPQMFVPLPDGRFFFVWRDAKRTSEELAKIHAQDGDGYLRWCAFWSDAIGALRRLFDDTEALDPKRVLPAQVYRRLIEGSAAALVEEFFEHPAIRGAFASQGIVGTWASVRDPGTAWVLAYHALGGEIYGSDGAWGFVRGGMGALSRAVAASAGEAGAQIIRGTAATEVVIEGGRAVGVRLANGLVVRSMFVLSSAPPQTTFLDLVPHGVLDASFTDRVSSWRAQGCQVKVNLAVTELPEFVARPGRGPQHHGTVEIAPSLEYLHEAFVDAQNVGHSAHPWMEVFVPSTIDTTLVDGSGHVVSIFAQYVAPKSFDPVTTRDHATDAVVRTLHQYAPNIAGAIVAVDALGPADLEEQFRLPGGDIFHGSLLPDQSFTKRFDYRTPISALYLCGSGARPGGAVTGAPGRNAAKLVLDDLRRR